MNKFCKKCKLEKETDQFRNKRNTCRICEAEYSRIYAKQFPEKKSKSWKKHYNKNRQKLLLKQKMYASIFPDKIINRNKNYYHLNKCSEKERLLLYKLNNKDKILHTRSKYIKNRKLIDPTFKIRLFIFNKIHSKLKNVSGSILQYLPYSIQELKQYLEKQFEPWMNWSNHGVYRKNKWNDSDQSTWTWQIDHIIPQSKLPYVSMEDDNFKKCWALENLRPYSAKQNIIDGAR